MARAEISLKDVLFEEFYFPPQDDVISKFFIPALKCSDEYDRATGYFTSSALIELSIGVCDLARRGGKVRVITSPRLFSEDVIAIKRGYDLAQTVGESMATHFEEPKDLEDLDRLSLLSELISMGVLEMKVAVMKNLDSYPNAMFHPKFGIMIDEYGNKVAFTGSMNESQNGLKGNWDHIEVSLADPIYQKRISKLQERFDRLWNGLDESVLTLDMPEVVKELIGRYKVTKSMLDLDELLLKNHLNESEPESVYFKSPDWLNANPRPYQEEAIQNWVDAGYYGIFNMATGTGKTKTALRALERLYNAKPDEGIFTVIVAPQKHLVDQWAEEIKQFGVTPLVGHSDADSGAWKERFRRKVMQYRAEPVNACLVTTIASFSMREVQEWIEKIDHLAIVIDEAHNMGSSSRLNKLPLNADYRLALSATMDRYNDAIGTYLLRDYFGKDCIYFPLEKAIGKYLTNYNYYPIVCYYSQSEYNEIVCRNEALDAILCSSANEKTKKKAKQEYVEYGYTLNAKMESKFTNLERLMRRFVGNNHFLVYSGKVKTDDLGDFENSSHNEFLHAIDKCVRILGMNGLGMKISRITYKENAEDRKRILSEFEKGDTEGIVAISCLDEGVDIPSIRTAVIMSSSDNPREYIQRRGRVLRLSVGKDHADIYDFIVVPRPLDEVKPDQKHIGLELKILAKEIRRMEEFARSSLNPDETEAFFREITAAYGIPIADILENYGVEQ